MRLEAFGEVLSGIKWGASSEEVAALEFSMPRNTFAPDRLEFFADHAKQAGCHMSLWAKKTATSSLVVDVALLMRGSWVAY
jgi:hypothetical protein